MHTREKKHEEKEEENKGIRIETERFASKQVFFSLPIILYLKRIDTDSQSTND